MTNDYKKGYAYRIETDSNFRKRKSTAYKIHKLRMRKLQEAHIPPSKHKYYELHHMGGGRYKLMTKAAHTALHQRNGNYTNKIRTKVKKRA